MEHSGIFWIDGDCFQVLRRSSAASFHELAERQKTCRRVAQDDTQYLFFSADPAQKIFVIKVFGFVRCRARPRAGKLDRFAYFTVTVRRQRHNRDAADLLQRKIQVGKLNDIGQLNNDAVEGLKPFDEKVESQMLRAYIQLRVSDGLLAIDDRHAIGTLSEDVVKGVAQRPVFPVAFGAIPSGEFGREPYNTG